MFRVIELPDDSGDILEAMGSKPKIWFKSAGLLFKEGRPDTGDDWSEKVAEQLFERLDIPHAYYELAVWRGRRGVVSRTFIPSGGRLVVGNELLAHASTSYPRRPESVTVFRTPLYTVRRVSALLGQPRIMLPPGWRPPEFVHTAADLFTAYLMVDVWIANQDRHDENWGIMVTPERALHLVPSFDHASSLGSNERDSVRMERLTTKDKPRSIESFVLRARTPFFADSGAPLTTLEAFQQCARIHPEAARGWLGRLERITSTDLRALLGEVPRERISESAINFAVRMLELNQRRLLDEGLLS
jgi:hypothetical protein